MGVPAVHEFASPGPSGRLVISEGPEEGTTRFDVELDRNLGGIWPRLHVEVAHQGDPAGRLAVASEPVRRAEPFRGRSTLRYSVEPDPDVRRAVAEALQGRLARSGATGVVRVLAVDTSMETGPAFGRIMGEVVGSLLVDHLRGREPCFEETVRIALDAEAGAA